MNDAALIFFGAIMGSAFTLALLKQVGARLKRQKKLKASANLPGSN